MKIKFLLLAFLLSTTAAMAEAEPVTEPAPVAETTPKVAATPGVTPDHTAAPESIENSFMKHMNNEGCDLTSIGIGELGKPAEDPFAAEKPEENSQLDGSLLADNYNQKLNDSLETRQNCD